MENSLCGFIRQAFVQIFFHHHYDVEPIIQLALDSPVNFPEEPPYAVPGSRALNVLRAY